MDKLMNYTFKTTSDRERNQMERNHTFNKKYSDPDNLIKNTKLCLRLLGNPKETERRSRNKDSNN